MRRRKLEWYTLKGRELTHERRETREAVQLRKESTFKQSSSRNRGSALCTWSTSDKKQRDRKGPPMQIDKSGFYVSKAVPTKQLQRSLTQMYELRMEQLFPEPHFMITHPFELTRMPLIIYCFPLLFFFRHVLGRIFLSSSKLRRQTTTVWTRSLILSCISSMFLPIIVFSIDS